MQLQSRVGSLLATALFIVSNLNGGANAFAPYHLPVGYGYHANYFGPPLVAPTCSAAAPCYDYLIVLTLDGIFDFSAGNATQFRVHYAQAGFDRPSMIAEGRRAATFIQKRLGVDLSGVSDEQLLAPDVEISDGVRFTFVTVRPTLYMAAKGDRVGFLNVPASAVWWSVKFADDYVSTGSYRGTVPAGANVYYGSFVSDTCPGINPNHPHRGGSSSECMLSKRRNGLKFFRFYSPNYETSYAPGPFVLLHSVLLDDEWGTGRSRGVVIADPTRGVITGHDVLTFPDTCSKANVCQKAGRIENY